MNEISIQASVVKLIGTIVGQQWRHENFHKLEPFGPF